jgi:hypothetical protein
MAKLSRRQRIDNDIPQLFDYMGRLDDDYAWQAEVAFDIAQVAYEDAYRTGDDTDAVAFTEDVAAPIVAHAHTDAPEPEPDLAYWRDRLADIPGENTGMKIPPSSDRMAALHETVTDQYEPNEFDQIIGIFSAGMGPLYTVEDYFTDAEPVVVRYSKNRGDTAVTVSPTMADRLDAADAQLLLVDDGLDEGGSLYRTGSYLTEQGADDIQCIVAQAHTRWPVMDAFEPAPYEDIREAVEQGEIRES